MSFFGLGSTNPGSSSQTFSGWAPQQKQLAEQLFPQYMQQFGAGGLFSGDPAYQVNPDITRQFFQQSIYQPTMREFSQTTLPGIREGYSNLWSSARMGAENQARMDTQSQLSSQLGQLLYSDEQSRRQAATEGLQRAMQGYQIGAGFLSGTPMSTVVTPNQHGLFSGIFGGSGPLGLL